MRFLKIILGGRAGRRCIAPPGAESSPWQRPLARGGPAGRAELAGHTYIDRSRDDTTKPARNMIDLRRRGRTRNAGLAGSRDGRVVLCHIADQDF